MGLQINTNTRKADFEFAAFRTFHFEKILNNDCQDPDENFFNAFNFKDPQQSPQRSEIILARVVSQFYTQTLEVCRKTSIAFSIC